MVILIISHVNPLLRSSGNEIRILKMINWLRSEKAYVVLLLNLPPLSVEIRSKLLEIVDAVYTPDECSASITKKIENAVNRICFPLLVPETEAEKVRTYLGRPYLIQATGVLCKRYRPQAVIAEYVFATPCLREVPSGVLKIVDTHGVFSRRSIEDPHYCSRQEERSYLLNADVTIAIQSDEADCFRLLVPERKVVTVGIDYDVVKHDGPDGACKNTVLVVGSNYPANISGLKAFCEHAWPIVCEENPHAELLVAGKIRDAVPNNIPRVKTLGWVDDLRTLYRQSAIVINSTMTGIGLKIKTVEALCNGKALVATPNAVEGLDFSREAPCMVRDHWPGFAGAIISLLESDERRLALQESALRFAEEQFSGRKVYAQMKDILWNQVQWTAGGGREGEI